MSNRNDIYAVDGYLVTVGLSQVLGITITGGVNSSIIKHFAGGTLEIGGSTLTWGQGYPFSVGEAISFNRSCTVYLAATGATVTVAVLDGKSSQ